MKSRSIFRKRNPDVEALFADAGAPSKVMCVAFDYAKKSHTGMVCNGEGHQLKGAFDVRNDREGFDWIQGVVADLCRRHRIDRRHVFFGGEDCGSYAFNFIHALVQRGFLVVGFNARHASSERENSKASTDLIDTIGVAGMMIKMRGRTIGESVAAIHGIKRLRRQRGALLKAHSASAHRTYRIVDELFPGFLSYECSGITPFSRASMWLMEERFSPDEIHARKTPHLVRKLRELALHDPEGVACKLKSLAEKALPPANGMVPSLQRSLADELALYRHLERSLHRLDTDIAKQLARTPGALLTTIPGVGLRWAAGLYSELADPMRRRNVHSMAALGGIVPRLKQSGGPDRSAVVGHRCKKGSAFLKNILMGTAVSISQYGHPELKEAYRRDKQMGRDARGKLAQHVLRVSLCIIDHQIFYLPPSLHAADHQDEIRHYYQVAWRKVLVKWRDSGAILEAVAQEAPLRQWRDMAQELYGIELDLRSPQTGRK